MTTHATRTVPGRLPTAGRPVGFTVDPWDPSHATAVAVEAVAQLGATTFGLAP
jgi:hypothetical protein